MNREQLKTILWLRWRLSKNQWMRGGGLGAIIAVLVGVGAFLLGGLCFVIALLVGVFMLGHASAVTVMGAWLTVTLVFLFFWTIGLLTELQRSETIDLQQLMHLPVALGQMFVVNYLASHFALSLIIMVPAMLGLAIGLIVARGPEMLLLIPLAMSMVFMITAWTYCLRGWLATMMANPRRRRAIIVGVTMVLVLAFQLPNLYLNVLQPQNQRNFTPAHGPYSAAAGHQPYHLLLAAQDYVPPLWVSVGARRLAQGDMLPALLATLGCFGLGTIGLYWSYRRTIRFYHGQIGDKSAKRREQARAPGKAGATRSAKRGGFLELRLPAVPEQSAALALATFRSMLRAPEVKMALGMSFVMTIVIGASLGFRSASQFSPAARPFVAAAVAAFSIFTLVRFFSNQFGFDRDGFRALVLSPTDRRHILLGKNLACLPVGAVFGTILLSVTAIWLHLPLTDFVTALLQLLTALLIAEQVGNVCSILVPYRIRLGSLKPSKMPGQAMVTIFVCQLLFPIAMAPVFLPPLAGWLWHTAGGSALIPINLLTSLALTALVGFVYWQTLKPLGHWLQRRETKILSAVTVEVE